MNPEIKKYIEALNSKLISDMAKINKRVEAEVDPMQKKYLEGAIRGLNLASDRLEADLDQAQTVEISEKQHRGFRR